MTLELIIGLGIAIALLLILVFKLPEQHFIFKLFMMFIVISLLLLIPKVAIDMGNASNCEWVLNSTSTNGTDHEEEEDTDYSIYIYIELCSTPGNPHNTDEIFFKIVTWFQYAFWLYCFMYANWWFWLGYVIRETKTYKKMQKHAHGRDS